MWFRKGWLIADAMALHYRREALRLQLVAQHREAWANYFKSADYNPELADQWRAEADRLYQQGIKVQAGLSS